MLKTLTLVSCLFFAGAAAFAGPESSASAKAAAKSTKAAVLICPVTGEKISSIKDAAGSSTYKGKTYYFCCPACKPMFDKDPAKYIHKAAAAKPARK